MSDPLHGVTLKALLTTLVERYGWEELAEQVPVRCFQYEPTLNSSLKLLRKTPWARAKVEALYLRDHEAAEAKRQRNLRRAARRAFARMPVEREHTLALSWPAGAEAPRVSVLEGIEVVEGMDSTAFRTVQAGIGFEVAELPDVLHVCTAWRGDAPVAVAAAVEHPDRWVELAWVAVVPEARGLGLGALVSRSVVAWLLEHDHRHIMGSTLDDRLHALPIYLDMGFEPVIREGKEARWETVLEQVAAVRRPG